jgi:hypothetical protein
MNVDEMLTTKKAELSAFIFTDIQPNSLEYMRFET